MRDQMLPRAPAKSGRKGSSVPVEANASTWWRVQPQQALLTGLLQQEQPFRDDANQCEVSLVLLPDEDGEHAVLHQVEDMKGGKRGERLYMPVEGELHSRLTEAALASSSVSVWGVHDYMAELGALAESMDRSLEWCAKRFGAISVPACESGWHSHPALGFWNRHRGPPS